MIKDKKSIFFFFFFWPSTVIDLKNLGKFFGFGGGNFRLSSDQILFEALGVQPGSVNPFSLYKQDLGSSEGKIRSEERFEPRKILVLVDENLTKPPATTDRNQLCSQSEAHSPTLKDLSIPALGDGVDHFLLFHPLQNTASTAISFRDFVKFMLHCCSSKHVKVLNFELLR